ncbi:uncharacterized protein C8A04DRAFT_31299 [Dichotomopilus funicola]|uniref:Protein kinase domain-containing protein n=1 Tax=Dichotomopilus funicola TaxID=1934379 RepID=A0AAN6UXN9_9PEZI|nr:hypothetical protein C8A04DRAFT_31299 [Dichotomopilus funicola]
MRHPLLVNGQVQVLGQTLNSVIYAVATDNPTTHLAKDSPTVLKGGTVWYEGREALGPNKPADETDTVLRKEAAMYTALGPRPRILRFVALEEAVLPGGGIDDPRSVGEGEGEVRKKKAWGLRLERASVGGSIRERIRGTAVLKQLPAPAPAPDVLTRLTPAAQFAEGVAHIHACGIIWGDLSTRNALWFDDGVESGSGKGTKGLLKLCDFADSEFFADYSTEWYDCESRYCRPGSTRPHRQQPPGQTLEWEISALGSAVYEIV